MSEREQLEAGITALQAQRAVLGDAVVEMALAPLRAQLSRLDVARRTEAQQLRLVSVLFADVVGSTAMGQQLDPEDTHTIMDGALQKFAAVIEAHQGRVLRFMGDGLLAAFGADGAREDDPERAVRAGLALLEEGKRHAAQVALQHRVQGFDVRVGINTGNTLVGGGVEAENTAMGMTVNIAARMEQTAPPGGLRISHDTYRHIRGVFDVEEQEPLAVKGRDEPLVTYLVQRVKLRAFRVPTRGIDGVETPMVGRYGELTALTRGFETVLAERTLRAFTVVGDAGLGKSRLLAEFQNALETHPRSFWLLLGRAQPNAMLRPYGLLRDVIAWRFQIADSDSAESARRKLVDGMAPLFVDEGALPAHLLGQLIGLDFSASPLLSGMLADGRQIRDRGFQAAAQLLRRLAESDDSPLVMLLDDLHWADDGSLDFIHQLMQQQRDLPLLLVMLARPALFERRANWVLAEAPHRRIDVAPLGAEDSGALTEVLLQRMAEVPEVLRALLTSRAEGNPFYMEELVKMLIDDGVIRVDADGWQVRPDRLLTARVPATLTGVLQARIDALAPTERSALQHAAVVGHVFWDAALDALEPGAASALATLLRKELIVRRDGSAFDDAIEYSFGHHLLHQVCYDTVLKAPRRAGHAAAAAWLAQRVGERTNEFLAVTAEHYDHAGDELLALDFFEKAAIDASGRFANAAALAHAERALANPRLGDLRRRWALLALKVMQLDRMGDRAAQGVALVEYDALADAIGDDRLRARARGARALLADRLGDRATSLVLAHEAWVLAERADSPSAAALALGQIAWVHRIRGELGSARRFAEQGLEWALRVPEEPYTAQLLLVMIEIAKASNDHDGVGLLLDRARETIRATPSSRRSLGNVLLASSQHASALGDWPQAQLHAEAALQANREVGIPHSEAADLCMLSECAREQGDPPSALARADAALAIYTRLSDKYGQAMARDHIGHAQRAAGAWAEALVAFEQAFALYDAVDDATGRRTSLAQIAEAHLECGNAPLALPLVERVLHDVAQSDEREGGVLLALICHRVFAAMQDPRAERLLVQAHDALQAMAARIGDATIRARMLNKVSAHRAVAEAWSRRAGAAPPATQDFSAR
ncbi:MAG: adenylate/guanylate cyclase domain-containing protein [Burkholderiales bacterium]|nr:adenylate/guanylate cyclase domain-containing protein [Burkholderiales bacterium]